MKHSKAKDKSLGAGFKVKKVAKSPLRDDVDSKMVINNTLQISTIQDSLQPKGSPSRSIIGGERVIRRSTVLSSADS